MGVGLSEPGFRTLCWVEIEEYPRSVLIAAQRAGYLAPAPIWDDLTTFDARPLAGAIDTLLAGYPCQPWSAAGKRLGADDPRHLWPHVARVARELGDGLRWIILENVAGHISLGAETVLRELWDMGFTPAAGAFSAAETGAPHERLRWFCVAYRESVGEREQDDPQRAESRQDTRRGVGGSGGRLHGDMAHPDGGNPSPEREQRGGEQRLQQESGGTGGGVVEDAISAGTGRGTPPIGERGRGAMDGRGEGLRRGNGSIGADRPTADGQGDTSTVGHPGPDADPRGLDTGTDRGSPREREGQGSERERVRDRSGRAVDHVDDSAGSRCQPEGIRPEADSGGGECVSGAGRDDVADTGQPGPQRREQRGSSDQRNRAPAHGSTPERGSPRLHPPGPGDSAAWAYVLAADPSRAPAFARRDVKTAALRLASVLTPDQAEAVLDRAREMEIGAILSEMEREAPELVEQAETFAGLRDLAHGLAQRSRALRLLGNGVHPLAAGYAWRTLSAAHGLGPVDLEAAGRDTDRAAVEFVVRAAE